VVILIIFAILKIKPADEEIYTKHNYISEPVIWGTCHIPGFRGRCSYCILVCSYSRGNGFF